MGGAIFWLLHGLTRSDACAAGDCEASGAPPLRRSAVRCSDARAARAGAQDGPVHRAHLGDAGTCVLRSALRWWSTQGVGAQFRQPRTSSASSPTSAAADVRRCRAAEARSRLQCRVEEKLRPAAVCIANVPGRSICSYVLTRRIRTKIWSCVRSLLSLRISR